jgi:hypothetical protein
MKKRILAFFLAVLMIFGTLPSTVFADESGSLSETEDINETSDSSDSVTRAEWLTKLTEQFEFYVEEDNYPDNYFGDLSADSESYYVIIQKGIRS